MPESLSLKPNKLISSALPKIHFPIADGALVAVIGPANQAVLPVMLTHWIEATRLLPWIFAWVKLPLANKLLNGSLAWKLANVKTPLIVRTPAPLADSIVLGVGEGDTDGEGELDAIGVPLGAFVGDGLTDAVGVVDGAKVGDGLGLTGPLIGSLIASSWLWADVIFISNRELVIKRQVKNNTVVISLFLKVKNDNFFTSFWAIRLLLTATT